MKKAIVLAAVFPALTFMSNPVLAFSPIERPNLIAIDKEKKAITFAAIVMADKWQSYIPEAPRYEEDGSIGKEYDPEHWHLIISSTQANPAIGRVPMFAAWVTDVAVSEALASLGAKGEEFPHETYLDYATKDSPYPDMRPQGTPIRVYVTWKSANGEEKTIDINEAIENSTGQKLEPVYIGKQHPSHCIICMYGCVGAICPNRSLTVKDFFDRGATWRVKEGVLPSDNTPVLITLQLAG